MQPSSAVIDGRSTGFDNSSSEVQKLTSGPVIYTEAQLSARFQRCLREHGQEAIRCRITYPGLPPLCSDLGDATANVL